MYMIFTFSAQSGEVSSTVSYKASSLIVKAADKVFDMGLDDYQISYFATKIHGVTRKVAHMTEYFLLAIAVSFPLYVYGLHGILLMLLAGGFCIAFACGDEYHQSFVAGRSPSSRDVLIDGIGVFIGIIIVRIIGWTGRMTIFRPIKTEPGEQKLTRKQKKQMKKQMKAMQASGYGPGGPYANMGGGYGNVPPNGANGYQGPDPNFQNAYGPYPSDGYQNGYQNGPYPNDGYQNGYQNGPYPNGGYQNGYQNGPYPNGEYQNGYQNGPYPNEYPNGYQNGPYNGPYQNGPYPYEPQAPQYMGRQDHSSDELSDDMPLSHLLKPKK